MEAVSPQVPALPFELASLARAHRYQRWVFDLMEPWLGQSILEVGAGIGNVSRWLPLRERLVLTELEPDLIRILEQETRARFGADPRVRIERFSLGQDDPARFEADGIDTVVSFNVLEHIEDDAAALRAQVEILRAGSRRNPGRPSALVAFVPAHGWAYGGMDRTFGHHRRYSLAAARALCRRVAPEARASFRHFNLPGLLGWWWLGRVRGLANFGSGSVEMFEKLCPVIRPLDDLLHGVTRLPLGQSLRIVLEWPGGVTSKSDGSNLPFQDGGPR